MAATINRRWHGVIPGGATVSTDGDGTTWISSRESGSPSAAEELPLDRLGKPDGL
jgi:hypothetical protein